MTDASPQTLILIDTNIWVDHFQRANRHVLALLDAGSFPWCSPGRRGRGPLLAFGRDGHRSIPLRLLRVEFTFSTAGAVLAETFVAMPFPHHHRRGRAPFDGRALRGGGVKPRGQEVDDLPAGDPPDDRPVAGRRSRAYAWARALGEFGATITFAGDVQGRTADPAPGRLPGPAGERARRRGPLPSPSWPSPSWSSSPSGAVGRAPSAGRPGRRSRCRHRRVRGAPPLEVADGEVLAVLGPNGSGKSRCSGRSPVCSPWPPVVSCSMAPSSTTRRPGARPA